MQRVKLVIMMVVLSAGLSGQSVELVELANPAKIIVLKNRLFVSEKTRVFVYSLANNKFIKEFGKPGEGPGEFKLGHGETGVKLNVNENFIFLLIYRKKYVNICMGKFGLLGRYDGCSR